MRLVQGSCAVCRPRWAWSWALLLGIAGAAHAADTLVLLSGQEQQKSAYPLDARTIVFALGSPAPLTVTEMPPRQSGESALASPPQRQLASGLIQPGSSRPVALAPLIDRVAQVHDIDPLLLHAIARVESRHQPGALSPAGAQGLMQVMAPTARKFGVDDARELRDPLTNLDVSARYLKSLQSQFGNDLPLVLAAYNAGEGAVKRYGGHVPPYRETQGYVRKVLAEYDLLLRVSGRPSVAVALSRTDS